MSIHRFLIVAAIAFSTFASMGCQSSQAPTAAAPAPAEKAIVISGNAGSITVLVPSADKQHADVLYASSSGETCPDCRQAAAKYFLTGQLEAKCPTCGATRTAVTYVTPSVSHN